MNYLVLVVFVVLVFTVVWVFEKSIRLQRKREKEIKDAEADRAAWRKRIERVGGQRYYNSFSDLVGCPLGLYRAKWITPSGQVQWFTVGITKHGAQWVGNEISKPSPRHVDDFVEWFGPDEVWQDNSE